ncbi:MAG: hypothetical protein ACYTDY_13085 [Planctomycetota bacterium]|jgi:hypothetical protein
MRSLHVVALCGLLFVAPAGGQSLCGTIDTTGATVEVGTAPMLGTKTIEPCPVPGAPPMLPPIGGLGTPGTFTGSLPAFPGGGDGSNLEFHATGDMVIPGGTYNHTTYRVDNSATVTYSGPVTIRTTGDVNIEGSPAP